MSFWLDPKGRRRHHHDESDINIQGNAAMLCLDKPILPLEKRPSWPSSCGSWIYNYVFNQCLSPWRGVLNTALCDKICQ